MDNNYISILILSLIFVMILMTIYLRMSTIKTMSILLLVIGLFLVYYWMWDESDVIEYTLNHCQTVSIPEYTNTCTTTCTTTCSTTSTTTSDCTYSEEPCSNYRYNLRSGRTQLLTKESPSCSGNKIPKRIIQTWHSNIYNMPKNMYVQHMNLRARHPEFEVHFFDDDSCRSFLEKHFDERVLNTFDGLVPGAYKSDIFRYCALYVMGGFYVDVRFDCKGSFTFDQLIEEDMCIVQDLSGSGGGIYQGFIASKPGNSLFLDCIDQIITNVETKDYTDSPLGITGPLLLSRMSDEYIKDHVNFELRSNCVVNQIVHKFGNKDVILESYKEYNKEREMSYPVGSSHYSDMWSNRNVFL